MKKALIVEASLLAALLSSGCGTQLALSGQAREDYLKSIKAYGEHWVKANVSTEQWRQDWVGCGGNSRGSYSTDVPSGSPSQTIFAASREMRKKLGGCMQRLGYTFQPGDAFQEP